MVENYSLSTHLQQILTPAEFVALCENHGGRALYIAQTVEKMSHDDIPPAAKAKLVEHFGGIYITPPLARQYRALYYKKQGYNKRWIAGKLKITESACRKLFARAAPAKKAEKPNRPTNQMNIFDYLIAQRHS